MGDLTDKYILECMSEAREIEFEPQFSLEDFVGKTIESHRRIKNPRKYNPQTESPNPEYFDVLVFSDKTFLLTKMWGDGECAHLNAYYFNGNRTLYSDSLFDSL